MNGNTLQHYAIGLLGLTVTLTATACFDSTSRLYQNLDHDNWLAGKCIPDHVTIRDILQPPDTVEFQPLAKSEGSTSTQAPINPWHPLFLQALYK